MGIFHWDQKWGNIYTIGFSFEFNMMSSLIKSEESWILNSSSLKSKAESERSCIPASASLLEQNCFLSHWATEDNQCSWLTIFCKHILQWSSYMKINWGTIRHTIIWNMGTKEIITQKLLVIQLLRLIYTVKRTVLEEGVGMCLFRSLENTVKWWFDSNSVKA